MARNKHAVRSQFDDDVLHAVLEQQMCALLNITTKVCALQCIREGFDLFEVRHNVRNLVEHFGFNRFFALKYRCRLIQYYAIIIIKSLVLVLTYLVLCIFELIDRQWRW